jgi:spermidine synthase
VLLRGGAGERAIGQVYAANTLGAILGVLAAVHLGLPALGLKGTLISGALLDALLGLLLLYRFAPDRTAPAPWRWLTVTAASCLLAFLAVALLFELNPNKMTAGVFRHGDLSSSATAKILFNEDGKTATVHLVGYGEILSIRTNGKSDGSINMDRAGARGSDEITMVLTGALPLALKPEAKNAAVIGIGTGLTMHTLLQNLALERVETVEIEAAMAQAARGFAPRNSSAFADPRGLILIDDAKTFFSTRNRHYDIIVSEPSNPWVSGVASLFTREFYRRIRGHLNPGGVLVQWFQLYEIDASLLATVMRALGETFAHYAVFAPSDHDLLIVASAEPLPAQAQAQVFEQPTLAQELRQINVYTAGDLDARYLGSRATLEPMFASYGMPANSDYYPVLDLNAARHRFLERSAADVVAMLNAGVPVLEMLEPGLQRRPMNAALKGAETFERIENTRIARYARDFLLRPRPPEPIAIPSLLQKDLEIAKLRLIECRAPAEHDVWLHSLLNVARAVNPHLRADEAAAIWSHIAAAPCHDTLPEHQRQWIALFAAVAARDGGKGAELAQKLLASQNNPSREAHEYLVVAGMTGHLVAGHPQAARALWDTQAIELRNSGKPLLRLLRCHAQRGEPGDCADAFRGYAD